MRRSAGGVLLARKQGQSWAARDSDLRFIDEIMGALDISALAFRDLGALSGRNANSIRSPKRSSASLISC